MAPHSSTLAWRIPGTGNLVGCRLWGRTESDTTKRLGSSSSSSTHSYGENVWVCVCDRSEICLPYRMTHENKKQIQAFLKFLLL